VNASPLESWIIQALTAAGGSATSLDVSKYIWAERRTELEESGDLLYRWQIELRTVADAMTARGLLTDVADTWTLSGTAGPVTAQRTGWTDDDISVAVDAYVSLLEDRAAGRPARHREAATSVRDETSRTAAAVDALFANISAVVQELGVEPLTAYPPRSNVPRGVRQAVRASMGDTGVA